MKDKALEAPAAGSPKHTPGPWEAGKASDGTWYIHEAAALGLRPAWIPAGCVGAVRPTRRSDADAKLIAAAPALADALEATLKWVDGIAPSVSEKARAALRAAGRLP